jgi:hypothetical protein
LAQARDHRGRPVGSDKILLYPEGRAGKEIALPIQIKEEFCPDGCPRDAIMLEISDTEVWFSGYPVVGMEKKFPR